MEHNGKRDGYRSYLVFDPETKAGVAFLTNGHCSLDILTDFRVVGIEILAMMAGDDIPLPVVNNFDPPLPTPLPEPPGDPDTYLLVRDFETAVLEYRPDRLTVALPGQRCALTRPQPGQPQAYAFAPFLGGAFRDVRAAPATLGTDGLKWSQGMAPPFSPTRKANLGAYKGVWGGTLAGDSFERPVRLRVSEAGVELSIESDRMALKPASDAAGRLVALAGDDPATLVRIVLAPHAGNAELVGTWQSGPDRYLLHLHRGEHAGWKSRFDPGSWIGKWVGDAWHGLGWSSAEVSVVSARKATINVPALGLAGAEVREFRLSGNRISFSAGGWQFALGVAGPLMSGEATGPRGVALVSWRAAN
jgi:hypothetical protein